MIIHAINCDRKLLHQKKFSSPSACARPHLEMTQINGLHGSHESDPEETAPECMLKLAKIRAASQNELRDIYMLTM